MLTTPPRLIVVLNPDGKIIGIEASEQIDVMIRQDSREHLYELNIVEDYSNHADRRKYVQPDIQPAELADCF